MASLPENVIQAWEDREGPIILATSDEKGCPNIIYATCVGLLGDDAWWWRITISIKPGRNLLKGVWERFCFATRRARRIR